MRISNYSIICCWFYKLIIIIVVLVRILLFQLLNPIGFTSWNIFWVTTLACSIVENFLSTTICQSWTTCDKTSEVWLAVFRMRKSVVVSKSQNTVWGISGTREPKEALFTFCTLLPAWLIRSSASVQTWIKYHTHWARLFVSNSFSTVPEILTRHVGRPGKEAVGSAAVYRWLRLLKQRSSSTVNFNRIITFLQGNVKHKAIGTKMFP